MMKKVKTIALLCVGAILVILLSGCMAFDVVMDIEEDGSGKLIYDVLWKTEYAERANGEIPEGTSKVDSITIDGQEYTGYRVTKNFSNVEELKSILLEKSGEGEFSLDEETGLRNASAFQLGNFVDSVEITKNDVAQTMNMRIVFGALDLASMMASENQDLSNKDIVTLYFNIFLPGNIVSATSDLADITAGGDSVRVVFTPDEEQTTTVDLSSDFSCNVYIYSDRQPPKESYTFTSDAAANKAQDEETRAQIKQDPIYTKEPEPSGTLVYIAAAMVFILLCAGVLFWQVKHIRVDTDTDKAYQRKMKRDQQLEEEYKRTSGKVHKNPKDKKK